MAALVAATLCVGALAVGLRFYLFPPHFRGFNEVTAHRTIAGWVINSAAMNERVKVQLYIDNRFVADSMADLPRPDVVAAGWTTDERCGYEFRLPSLASGQHEARVYTVHEMMGGAYRTLQLTGTPLRFTVDASRASSAQYNHNQ